MAMLQEAQAWWTVSGNEKQQGEIKKQRRSESYEKRSHLGHPVQLRLCLALVLLCLAVTLRYCELKRSNWLHQLQNHGFKAYTLGWCLTTNRWSQKNFVWEANLWDSAFYFCIVSFNHFYNEFTFLQPSFSTSLTFQPCFCVFIWSVVHCVESEFLTWAWVAGNLWE